ncbi:MAG: T9SS type A sorting domain-containing protein [Bacteroidota bacterium]
MKKLLLSLVLLSATGRLFAQDTVSVLQYNLLNYGSTYNSYCTSANNNYITKTGYISTIVSYVKPDIFTVNEIHPVANDIQYLLDNALNIGGVNYYQKINYTNYGGSDIVNTLFYNSNKFSLVWQDVVITSLRDINIYKMFYKPSLAWGDSVYVTFIQAHLKAGSTSSDASDRAAETNQLMGYLNSNSYSVNNLMMGDFNLYNSSEQAWINLTTNSNVNINFNDPINQAGMWNNNAYYKNYHTQSTNSSSDGCKASGGMDDRFDFILISNKVKNGLDKVKYIPGTYKTIGQDGNHFNLSINDGTNNSAPAAVIDALFNNSDHLPVNLKLLIDPNLSAESKGISAMNAFVENPANNEIAVHVNGINSECHIQLMSIEGRILSEISQTVSGSARIVVPVNSLKPGLYLVSVSYESGNRSLLKVVKTE